jgi:metal-responsive CopG/Arc/MetJ family transcriptional regulator
VAKTAPDTDREHITLPTFILHELDNMVGPYAGTRPEVIKWIIQTWLHENRDRVAQTVREYREFKGTVTNSDGTE